eukprot:IDg2380t1
MTGELQPDTQATLEKCKTGTGTSNGALSLKRPCQTLAPSPSAHMGVAHASCGQIK